jgi:tetratricopeptide (TPR) repeat protein
MQTFVSPLTGEGFSAAVQVKRAAIGSYDYDFCPHPAFNTLAYALVTDPATGWTDYPETFNQPCPLAKEKLAEALGEPKFSRDTPPGLPWLDPYPWEQYENAALQSAALSQSELAIGNWYMQAAWSVRLDVISGSNEFDSEVETTFSQLPKPRPDPQQFFLLYELQLAADWEQQRESGVLANVGGADFALALAWLYRSRGELAAADRWLDEAAAADSALPNGSGLYSFLRSSVDLERSYLQEAQRLFAAAWSKGGIDARREGLTAFALGEIARRLGDLPGARQWYGEAQRSQHGELNLDRLAWLQARANGRGY